MNAETQNELQLKRASNAALASLLNLTLFPVIGFIILFSCNNTNENPILNSKIYNFPLQLKLCYTLSASDIDYGISILEISKNDLLLVKKLYVSKKNIYLYKNCAVYIRKLTFSQY